MAPPPSSDSLASLRALREAARKNSHQAPEISLPERPRNFQNESPYSDAAIGVVGIYTAHLYNEHGSWSMEVNGIRQDIKTVDGKVGAVDVKIGKVDQKVDRFEQGATEALTELSDRLDDVEEDLKSLRKEVKDVQNQVKDVQNQFKSFQREVKSQFQEVNSQFDDIRSQFADLQSTIANTKAVQLNTYRKLLVESLEPVSVLVPVGDKQIFAVAPDFPPTIQDFWQLATNIPALIRLAKHYSVTGWERWQRSSSGETDRTEYADLDLAIAAHPYRCLAYLSSKWGMQYSSLERPRKRSADSDPDEWEPRSLKMRRTSGSDICETVYSRNPAGELTRQDQITRRGPPRPVPSDSVITHVYEKFAGAPGGGVSFESAELGWDANMASQSSPGSGRSRGS